MYEAAKYFSLEARQKAAERTYGLHNADCCIVGALLTADGYKYPEGDPFEFPMHDTAEEALRRAGIAADRLKLWEMIRANDTGVFAVPAAVRAALGV